VSRLKQRPAVGVDRAALLGTDDIRRDALPVEVDSSKIEARYADGILTIVLPKAEAARPRHITIAVS